MKMPVLFIGHGTPENIILKNDFTNRMKKLGTELPRPRAVLVISAHWLTNGTRVSCVERPETIYDFYGFPQELYQLSYPSPGSPQDAKFISALVKKPAVNLDYEWGLDHAAWAILRHIYPKADIPVLEMSLDYSPYNGWRQPFLQYFYDLGKQLAPLREKDTLIIGSGNIVHNLRLADMENIDAKPYDWAVEFDKEAKNNLLSGNHKALLNCRDMSLPVSLSIPTLDHDLPMIFTIAMQEENEKITFIHEGFQNRSVSMRCFRIG